MPGFELTFHTGIQSFLPNLFKDFSCNYTFLDILDKKAFVGVINYHNKQL